MCSSCFRAGIKCSIHSFFFLLNPRPIFQYISVAKVVAMDRSKAEVMVRDNSKAEKVVKDQSKPRQR